MIKVDLTGCKSFFEASGPDFAAAASAHRVLSEKTGQGADFTGWLELPRLIKRTELKGIIAAANKIRSRSKALVVVGIGGSYLGARGAIELLRPIQRADSPHVYFVGNGLSGSEKLTTVSNMLRGPSWTYWPMECRSAVYSRLAGKMPMPFLPSLSP